jgi:dolichol-phosphate mannosyltransferase
VRLAICLPTYNEHANLEPLVRSLGAVLAEHELDARVLVVDDRSPDGTGALAERLTGELAWVSVLHRERKQGLGPAYLAGFRRVLAEGAELVMEMDADGSHDPRDVPSLVQHTLEADLVIGSRYVPGGAIANWGPLRRAVSRAGCLYAQAWLGFGIRDATSGFRVFRRSVLETIDLDAIRTRGYAFQIETAYRAVRGGFRVVEVPITFVDREAGRSKMSRAIVAEAALAVPALRLEAARRRL